MANSDSDITEKHEFIIGQLLVSAAVAGVEKSTFWYTARPGFFVPFKSVLDAGCAVASPFALPIILGALGVVSGIAAILSAVACASCFLFAKGIYHFNEDLAENAIEIAQLSGLASCATAIASLLFAIGAIVAAPVTAVQLLTRTGATFVDQFDCDDSQFKEQSARTGFDY